MSTEMKSHRIEMIEIYQRNGVFTLSGTEIREQMGCTTTSNDR